MATLSDRLNTPKRTIFLGNFPRQVSNTEFTSLILPLPGFKEVKVWTSNYAGMNVLVQFHTQLAAANAFAILHGHRFLAHPVGQGLQVSYAKRELHEPAPRVPRWVSPDSWVRNQRPPNTNAAIPIRTPPTPTITPVLTSAVTPAPTITPNASPVQGTPMIPADTAEEVIAVPSDDDPAALDTTAVIVRSFVELLQELMEAIDSVSIEDETGAEIESRNLSPRLGETCAV